MSIDHSELLSRASSIIKETTERLQRDENRRYLAEISAIETAKNSESIKSEVSYIRSALEQESDERRMADIESNEYSRMLDEENRKYTKKQDKRNFVLGVIGAVTGIVGAITGVASFIISVFSQI